jgi:RNA polymerase sigma-70 factor (ECF subfamily)
MENDMSAALAFDPANDLAVHRGAMLRFARRRIRDEALAEDTVQDALLAALGARHTFQGQSAVRTWLIGILNHKIQDAFRRETRYVKLDPDGEEDGDAGERLERAAVARAAVADDDDPIREVARRRMHAALVEEVERLPEGLRSVFMMQAIEGVATSEVCRTLSLTEANVWVRLHRARKRLSERLEAHLEPA